MIMRKGTTWLMSILITVIFLTACTFSTGPIYTVHKLPSGKEIKIVNIGKMWSTNQETAMTLTYITDVPLSDEATLKEEVQEVWDVLRLSVEREGLTRATITAQSPPKGFIFTVKSSRAFGFEKNDSGEWAMM